MNKTVTIAQHNTKPNLFGGIVYLSDFCADAGNTTISNKESLIARRIISDWKFDAQCRHDSFLVERQKGFRK